MCCWACMRCGGCWVRAGWRGCTGCGTAAGTSTWRSRRRARKWWPGAGGAEAFAREAESWVGLGLHPHIVTCFYVRTLGGIPRVFAELVAGGSLADWIEDRRLYAGSADEALARLLDVAIQFVGAWAMRTSGAWSTRTSSRPMCC
jgi:hypothetical protein